MRASKCRDSVDVIIHLLEANPVINCLRFAQHIPPSLSRERVPNWKRGIDIPELFFHLKDVKIFSPLRRELLDHGCWRDLIANLSLQEMLNLWSGLRIGIECHLPIAALVDCGKDNITSEMVDRARQVFSCSEFGQPHGFILHSGNGLHFVGTKLIHGGVDKLMEFCGKLLLAEDFADVRYLGHRLIDRELTLRVARRLPDGAIQIPQVLAYW